MKRERHGRAKILTPDEIQLLFNDGLECARDRTLFGFCLYTACRINEACTQLTCDAYDHLFTVRPNITIRKGNSKGKLASRTVELTQGLTCLKSLSSPYRENILFPSAQKKTRTMAIAFHFDSRSIDGQMGKKFTFCQSNPSPN